MATNNAINLSAAGVVTYDGAGLFTGSTFAQYTYLVGGAANAITGLGPATNGQLLIGATGTTPALATLTAGSGISISNGSGSISISSTGGSTLPYTVVTGSTQAISNNNGYVANNATLVTFTLPATSAVGNLIKIVGLQGSWVLAQNSGQSVIIGNTATTGGVGGSLASTNANDTVSLVCVVANTTYIVDNSMGNLTVV